MTLNPIITNLDETVGKAHISDQKPIGVFDLKVLKEWIKELEKNTPLTERGGYGDRKDKFVVLSFVEKDLLHRPGKMVAICGQPVEEISNNILHGVRKDRAIVAANYRQEIDEV